MALHTTSLHCSATLNYPHPWPRKAEKKSPTLVHMLMCKNRAPLGLDRPWLAEGEPPRILDSCAHFKSVARCELASQAGLEDRGALCCNLDAM